MTAPDPVTVQIVRNRIASLMEEMDYRFYRSGYSTIVRESRDFSCVVTDRRGRLAVAPFMYFHAPVYFHLIRRILELYGEDGLDDGDVLVCNHPYEGNLPHVPDMALVRPVFANGTIVAFTASIAHKADMGGAVPGSTWGQATDLFQEGMLLPPVKIVRVSGTWMITSPRVWAGPTSISWTARSPIRRSSRPSKVSFGGVGASPSNW